MNITKVIFEKIRIGHQLVKATKLKLKNHSKKQFDNFNEFPSTTFLAPFSWHLQPVCIPELFYQ